jgi:hypothetical protein
MTANRHRKRHLWNDIVRLRRVERAVPENRDVVAVRASLEDQLGPSVSQRLAASLLGVSHTALGRWIASGDVPTVPTPAGRKEVPVPALLDLYETVEHEREMGRRRRHLIEPAIAAQRDRARRLRVRDLVPELADGADGHRRAELRALAYHRALAPRLSRPMIDDARHLLWTWRERGSIDARHADRWERLMEQPAADVRRAIGEDTPAARELRQTSPFAGMLSEPERRAILEQVR